MTITVPLTQNQVTIVSDEDADLAELRWYALFVPSYSNGGNFVARRSFRAGKKMGYALLHRVILSRVLGRELPKKDQVDHVNGNPLDNRRENLRLATYSQNNSNRPTQSNNLSGFKGVSFHKPSGKYFARIAINGKTFRLGYFTSPELAHEAYCKAARELHGEFANFGTHTTEAQP